MLALSLLLLQLELRSANTSSDIVNTTDDHREQEVQSIALRLQQLTTSAAR